MNNTMSVQRYQGTNDDGSKFGYIVAGDGGYFFTWMPTMAETLDSIEADEVDAPSFDAAEAREVLAAAIAGDF